MKSPRTPLVTAARLIQGGLFLLFGLNGFFNFLPQPPPPAEAANFAGALLATGYMIPLIKGTEIASALLLLSNRFVPLALAIIAPVIVNIVAFHAFLAPAGLALPLLLLATQLVLAFGYREAFAPMLKARVTPTAASSRAHVSSRPADAAA